MEIKSAFFNGVLSINRGIGGLEKHSGAIAAAPADPVNGDMQGPLVGMIGDRLQVEAGAKVVKAADAMLGSLFDAKA